MTAREPLHEPDLTERQEAILRALVRRRPIKQIAFDHAIAPSTVNDHIKAMKRKVGARSTAELVSFYLAAAEPSMTPPNGGATKSRVSAFGQVGNEPGRGHAEALAFSDSMSFSIEAPWAGLREPSVVPEELDGPAATVPRLIAIVKIIALILAVVVLSILALETVDGLIASGAASGNDDRW